MEEDLTAAEKRRLKIEPPSEAYYSVVANAMGNGAMVAGLPFLLLNLYDAVTAKTGAAAAHSTRNKVGIALTATGSILGAVFGVKEAERLQNYRHAVSDEVAMLRAEVNANSKLMASWKDKEAKRTAEPVADGVKR